MQRHHVILFIAAVAVGILTKQLFWPAKPADADTQLTNGIDVLQMQQDNNAKNLPGQTMDDRSFVYGSP